MQLHILIGVDTSGIILQSKNADKIKSSFV